MGKGGGMKNGSLYFVSHIALVLVFSERSGGGVGRKGVGVEKHIKQQVNKQVS